MASRPHVPRNVPARPLPAAAARDPGGAQDPRATLRHVHREREFGVGYGNSSGYAQRRHYLDGHADPMFRCG